MKQLRMRLLFHLHGADYIKKQVFGALKYRYDAYKRNQRLDRFSQARLNQRRQQKAFDILRSYSHKRYVRKLAQKETEFRAELESKILVQYRNKVDSLLLYAAELEDKIKMEQDAREQMTILYDQSLSKGFQVLGNETNCLSQVPLQPEILLRR